MQCLFYQNLSFYVLFTRPGIETWNIEDHWNPSDQTSLLLSIITKHLYIVLSPRHFWEFWSPEIKLLKYSPSPNTKYCMVPSLILIVTTRCCINLFNYFSVPPTLNRFLIVRFLLHLCTRIVIPTDGGFWSWTCWIV